MMQKTEDCNYSKCKLCPVRQVVCTLFMDRSKAIFNTGKNKYSSLIKWT